VHSRSRRRRLETDDREFFDAAASGGRLSDEQSGGMLMSPHDLGCVKTSAREEGAELFSLLSSPDSGRQRFRFSN
jgi:hypothetical protein